MNKQGYNGTDIGPIEGIQQNGVKNLNEGLECMNENGSRG